MQVLEERVNKALDLLKSKKHKMMTYCNFYFDFYVPHERVDVSSDIKFTYMQVFDFLEDKELLTNEGFIWRVKCN